MSDRVILLHLRRVMANRTECDPEDDREFADGPEQATCQACIDAYRVRAREWHADLAARTRLRRNTPVSLEIPLEPEDDTAPGKGQTKRETEPPNPVKE